jgi:homoserine O-acetyltransferase
MLPLTSKLFESGALALENGGELAELAVAYETYGTLNAAGDNGVLVCHGYTNSHHAAGDEAGWFSGLIGPGKAVDTGRYFVVAANLLGSAYGSSSPASINPQTGRPYGLDFPDVTIGDMVNAEARLLDHLGVKQLAAVIGNSLGGHLVFQWATHYPERMRAVVAVVTTIKGRGDQSIVEGLIARFGQCTGWNGGQFYGHEKDGGIFDEMVKFRIETLKQYGFDKPVRAEIGDNEDAVEKRLAEMAAPWAKEFDPHSLIALRKSVIQFNAEAKAGAIKAPLLYVLSRTDPLFPPSIAPELLDLLEKAGVDARYFELDSECGHPAPGIDWQGWAGELEKFLDQHAA